MTTAYPTGLDSFPAPGTNLDSTPNHDDMHIDVQDAVEAIELELGLSPSGVHASVAARLASHEADMEPIINRAGGMWRRVSTQSIPDATATDIVWDAEDEDAGGFRDPGEAEITIPVGSGGLYAVTASVTWAAAVSGFVSLNASSGFVTSVPAVSSVDVAGGLSSTTSAVMALADGQTVKVQVKQGSGGAVNVTARLAVYRVGN